jgi:cytidine deaminase
VKRVRRAAPHAAAEDPSGRELVRLARVARRRAVAPYSRFKVGAALRTTEGEVVTGCNIENATLGLTLCAERVAVYKAVSEGIRGFSAVAVVADGPIPPAPCGPCRQILWEFCGDVLVHMDNLRGERVTRRLAELLPLPFDRNNL